MYTNLQNNYTTTYIHRCSSYLLHDKIASHYLKLSTGEMLNFSSDCIFIKIKTSLVAGLCPQIPVFEIYYQWKPLAKFQPGLKVGRMIRTIWVTWVTFWWVKWVPSTN